MTICRIRLKQPPTGPRASASPRLGCPAYGPLPMSIPRRVSDLSGGSRPPGYLRGGQTFSGGLCRAERAIERAGSAAGREFPGPQMRRSRRADRSRTRPIQRPARGLRNQSTAWEMVRVVPRVAPPDSNIESKPASSRRHHRADAPPGSSIAAGRTPLRGHSCSTDSVPRSSRMWQRLRRPVTGEPRSADSVAAR